jgi:hypothetical protein
MATRKSTKDKQRSTKHTYKTKDRVTMTKRKKNKRTNNDLQNTTQKTMFPDLALLCYVLSSFMTNHRVCNYINTTGVTSGAGTATTHSNLKDEIEEEEINAALKKVLILLDQVNDLSKSAK